MQRNNQYSQPETTTIPRRMSARVSTCTGVACAWIHVCLLEEKHTFDREDGYDDAMGEEAAEPTSHIYNLLQYIKKMQRKQVTATNKVYLYPSLLKGCIC